jgi:hypothetical protein
VGQKCIFFEGTKATIFRNIKNAHFSGGGKSAYFMGGERIYFSRGAKVRFFSRERSTFFLRDQKCICFELRETTECTFFATPKYTFFVPATGFVLGGVEGAYTQQGRAHSRRLHRPLRWARAPGSNEPGGPPRRGQRRSWSASKSPPAHARAWAAPRRAVELWSSSCASRLCPLRRPNLSARSGGGGGARPPAPFGLVSPPAAAAVGAVLPWPLHDPRLGMRYHLAASSAPSSASWSRSCSNPGPSSPHWPKASGFIHPA